MQGPNGSRSAFRRLQVPCRAALTGYSRGRSLNFELGSRSFGTKQIFRPNLRGWLQQMRSHLCCSAVCWPYVHSATRRATSRTSHWRASTRTLPTQQPLRLLSRIVAPMTHYVRPSRSSLSLLHRLLPSRPALQDQGHIAVSCCSRSLLDLIMS